MACKLQPGNGVPSPITYIAALSWRRLWRREEKLALRSFEKIENLEQLFESLDAGIGQPKTKHTMSNLR